MAAGTYAIALEQGATFRFTMTYGTRGPNDSNGNPTLGEPYDLTGCIARMQIRQRAGGQVLVDLGTVVSPSQSGIMLGGATGTISIHISDEITELLTARRGKYDLKLIYPSGDEERILMGNVTISPAVTLEP